MNSDHFPLTMNVKLETAPHKRNKVEILNFKDLNSQIVFKENTSNTKTFSNCLKDVHKLSEGAQKSIETVKSHCKKAFKKIRTRRIKPSAADKLISERNKLLRQGHVKESRALDVTIAKLISEEGSIRAHTFKKSRIRETSNLSTDADRRTDTILESLRDLCKKNKMRKKNSFY